MTTAELAARERAARERRARERAAPERLAPAIRDAVLAVPGVSRLIAGVPVEVATLFAGGKVTGVRLADPIEVHVEVNRLPLGPVAEEVRAAVRAVLDGAGDSRAVEVDIDEIDPAALAGVPEAAP